MNLMYVFMGITAAAACYLIWAGISNGTPTLLPSKMSRTWAVVFGVVVLVAHAAILTGLV